jgi:hypothetical protein
MLVPAQAGPSKGRSKTLTLPKYRPSRLLDSLLRGNDDTDTKAVLGCPRPNHCFERPGGERNRGL